MKDLILHRFLAEQEVSMKPDQLHKPPDAQNSGVMPGAVWISLGHVRLAWAAQTTYGSSTPAPGGSPDPTHFSGPTVTTLLHPTAFDGNNIPEPTVTTRCTF